MGYSIGFSFLFTVCSKESSSVEMISISISCIKVRISNSNNGESKISFLNPETLISLNSLTIDENAVIYGYKGSSAEEYAITFERKFKALDDVGTKITGDVNSDGTFDISDAAMLKNYIINAGSLTDWTVGDLSEDGIIDIFDLALMKNLLIS